MKDYLLLFNENEKLKRIINSDEFYDDEFKSTTTGERTLTFKMKDQVVDIEMGDKIGIFSEGKFDLFIVDQVEAETYYSTDIKVTCLHDFYSIQEQKAITQYYSENATLREAITEILKGTEYVLGTCPERSIKPIGPYLYKNPLWCIQDIVSNFNVEIDYSIELNANRNGISIKVLNVVNALGSDTGIRCSTDLNVSKIKRVQKKKFYTVMYGCGAEYQKDLVKYKYDFKDAVWTTLNNPADKPKGQEFVEDKEAIAKYGRKIGIFEDGRIKEPELLLKKTWEALQKNNKPFVSYELDIEELKTEDGYEHLNFKLGDLIILQNTIDNSRAKFRIVEDCKSIRNKYKRKIVVGEQVRGIFSGGDTGNSDGTEGPGGSVIEPGTGEDIQPPSIEEILPDTLPAIPVVTTRGLWKDVQLSWTYENKIYYDYEVYASRIRDFEPTVFHMIYSGKASAFLHEAGANETWYYRVRAVNSFGNATQFSEQVEAHTTKVSDGTKYFENAAIKDALIEELRLDRGWIGTLRGHYIDARELSVTDGNGKKTLDIDSFGRITLMPSVFKMLIDGKEENIVTESRFEANNESINMKFGKTGGTNEILNSKCTNSKDYMYVGGHTGSPVIDLHIGKPGIQFTVKPYGSAGGLQTSSWPVAEGEKHTLAFDYVFERGMESYCEIHFYTTKHEGFGVWPDVKKEVIPLGNSGSVNHTVTVPAKAKYMKTYIYTAYNGVSSDKYPYAHVYISELRCFKSEIASPWVPASDEMYVSNIKFNGKGIEQTYNNEYKSRWGADALEFLTPNNVRKLAIDRSQFCTYNFDDGNFLSYIGATKHASYTKIFGNSVNTSRHCAFFDIAHNPDIIDDSLPINFLNSYFRVNFFNFENQVAGTHIYKYPLFVHQNLEVDRNLKVTQDLQVWGDMRCERNINAKRIICTSGIDMKGMSIENLYATKYGPGTSAIVKGDGQKLELGGLSAGDYGGTKIGCATSAGDVQAAIWISSPSFVWNYADWNFGGHNIYDVRVHASLALNSEEARLLKHVPNTSISGDVLHVDPIDACVELAKENNKLKEEQESQNQEIVTSMLANTEMFEMMLGMMPQTFSNRTNGGNENMVEVYVTLIIKGVKKIEDVPTIIRPQVIERLKQLEIQI